MSSFFYISAMRIHLAFCLVLITNTAFITTDVFSQSNVSPGKQPVDLVNVFLGSSGDHGQMSPAASYPFSMLSIGPQTYPNLHMGYEHKAKTFLGFTHNRFEGVGCQGSGGNILIKPFMGEPASSDVLSKSTENAGPGYYQVAFSNGIGAKIAVFKNSGVEQYSFPEGKKGLFIDLSHTLSNRFVAEEHQVQEAGLSGWIDSKTTCNVGTYRLYYMIKFTQHIKLTETSEHTLVADLGLSSRELKVSIALSSVDVSHASAALVESNYAELKEESRMGWAKVLGNITVNGDPEREKLFYSLLYRTVQSPYLISEAGGTYQAIDGSLQKTKAEAYNGWAIWDNYRTQLPLLSLLYPDTYKSIVSSIAGLYEHGKKDYATQHEPSNTVRTEHAIVVLLDAYRKGYEVSWKKIMDSLVAENTRLDYSHPDKALESSYDSWALSQIMAINRNAQLSKVYKEKALVYKDYWNKDFKDVTKNDVDRIPARGLYQGTVWQYRWFVPFDVKGLMALAGGEKEYLKQLDQFFDNDYYNHANETDIQVPLMYNMTSRPAESQRLMHKYAVDTVVQYYFNDNSRGIDPFVDVIYQNKPDAYIRTMDDDAGAMSAWYVFAATGLSPACVGWPIYYLNVPLFKEVQFNWAGGKKFEIKVLNFSDKNKYIQGVTLNGKKLERNWLKHQEILHGGTLVITAGEKPNNSWGVKDQWISDIAN
jgi:putative alpha-1,2-mannosidase